jgi:hypothetical protein
VRPAVSAVSEPSATPVAPGVFVSTRNSVKDVICQESSGIHTAEGIAKASSLFNVRFTEDSRAIFNKARLTGIFSGKSWFKCLELVTLQIESELPENRRLEIKN